MVVRFGVAEGRRGADIGGKWSNDEGVPEGDVGEREHQKKGEGGDGTHFETGEELVELDRVL